MTALAGIFALRSPPPDARNCAAMLAAQADYAPDDPGKSVTDGPVVMGRRLFATLPEDDFDDGPVASRDGRFLMVADIRLDEREAVASRCRLDRRAAAKLSDAALAMCAVERDGPAAIDQLIGDFALALWDSHSETLTLARDFAGMRPLYFHHGEISLAFASMPQGLHALPAVPPEPDVARMLQLLAGEPELGAGTHFRGISRVEPGHIVTVSRQDISTRRYWNPMPRATPPTIADTIATLRDLVDLAVRARLRRREPHVAAQLSGGLDSGMVVATAARTEIPITAFTSAPRAGFDRGQFGTHFADETGHAAAVATLYPNITHVPIRSTGQSPLAELDRHFDVYRRPLPNLTNGVWLADVAQAARASGARVLLSGAAGNLGFSWAGLEGLAELVRQGRLLSLVAYWRALRRDGLPWRTLLNTSFGPFLPRALMSRVTRHAPPLSVLNPDWERRLAGLPSSLQRRAGLVRRNFARRAGLFDRVDRGPYNAGLRAGWGLDLRDPMADRRLVEFCLSLPPIAFVAGGRSRGLARLTAADRLPAMIVNERRRGFQSADWAEGLMDDLAGTKALAEKIAADPAQPFDPAAITALIDDLGSRGWHSTFALVHHRGTLLRTLGAGHFLLRAHKEARQAIIP